MVQENNHDNKYWFLDDSSMSIDLFNNVPFKSL